MEDKKEAIYEEKFVNSTFCNSGHQKQNEYRKQALFTDIILRGIDGAEFPVHKIIIAAQCPYFEALFHSELKECSEDIIQLDRNISKDFLEQIIEYLYVGEININLENAKILNEIAVFLELRCLKNGAAKILEKSLTIDTALELWRYAVKQFNDDLSSYCLRFIGQNIEQFFEKFLINLPTDEFEKILNCDSLLCSHEFLYLNIMDWLKNDVENRSTDFQKLARHINFSKISEEFKEKNIFNDEILMNNLHLTKILLQEISWKKIDIKKDSYISTSVTNPFPEMKNIYAITEGWITKIDAEIYRCFLPIIEFEKKSGYSVCEYNSNSILISGGESTNSCISYTINEDKIAKFPSMIEERENHSLLSLNNKIYACGGYKNDGSMEVMDLGEMSWLIGQPLKTGKQTDFGIESWGGSIFAFGGVVSFPCINKYLKTEQKILDSRSVQRFDPRENVWHEVHLVSPQMRKPKCMCIDDSIYCFTDFKQPEIFDIRANKWTSALLWTEVIKSTRYYRYSYPPTECDAIKQDDCLYVFGRKFDQSYNHTSTQLMYDFHKKKKFDLDLDVSLYNNGRINLIKVSQ